MAEAQTEAALSYAARGRPVVPFAERNGRKVPLTEHGKDDATLDETLIREWFGRRFPHASVAIATGKASGVVACDIDIREGGSGLDSLEELGVVTHPVTPTAHTPSGGIHILFEWPGYEVPCSAGKIARFVDVRGDGGALILPPAPGRVWDPHLGPDTPLAQMPDWMMVRDERISGQVAPKMPPRQRISRYGEGALDSAVKAIVSAPCGEQRSTLNRECFAIGGLVAGGVIPSALALESLTWAAQQMPSHDARRPWRPAELQRQVRDAFLDGLQHPREVPDARR